MAEDTEAICRPKSTAFSVGKLSAEWMDERLVEWYLSQFVPPYKCYDAAIFKISEKAESLTEVLWAHLQTTNGPLESVLISLGPEKYSKQGPDASPTASDNIVH
jgi:hypothetical protein